MAVKYYQQHYNAISLFMATFFFFLYFTFISSGSCLVFAKSSKHPISWKIQQLQSEYVEIIPDKLTFYRAQNCSTVEQINPYIANIENKVGQTHFGSD